MKRIIVLLLAVGVILTACGADNRSAVEPTATPVSAPSPIVTATQQPTQAPIHENLPAGWGMGEKREWFTLDDVNELNKIFYFSRKGEYPEIRAFLMFSYVFSEIYEYNPQWLAQGMAAVIYNQKFLDKDNKFLTYKDVREIEWLKENQPENAKRWDDVAAGKYRLARVPLTEVDRLLQKYMGVSYKDLAGEEAFAAYKDNPVFYVREYTNTKAVACLDGYKQGEDIVIYSEGKTIKLKETDTGYQIVSCFIDYSHRDYNVYEDNGYIIEDFLYSVRQVYLYERPDQSPRFNEAISAFNSYLKKAGETQRKDMGILRYAIRDATNDNVPELIYYEFGRYGELTILSYIDGEIKQLETPWFNYSDGGQSILSNNMVASYWQTTGGAYTFYSYKPDGSYTSFSLEIPAMALGGEYTDFNGNKITEEEYKRLLKWCKDLFDDTADIDYALMYKEILY